MVPDPPSAGARPPVVLRIKLRYEDVDAMVQRFAPNVGKSGLFLPTKSLQPVGAEVKFELRLANDTPVLIGLGKVKVTKEPDPANPKASFGMAIELTRVTRESRDLILRMLERRKQLGLAEVAIPLPSDLDDARRSDFVDTGVKHAIPARDSSPVVESGPIPVALASRDSQPESLLTAPRRATGPLAVAKVTTIDPLPPEPPRKKRPAISELIEAASGPIAVHVPGLDDNVDVGAVIARARLLATGDLDAELDALRDASAAPLAEIGIEAASAELARQLGGVAVRRDSRGNEAPAGWAPPPAVVDEKRSEKLAEPAPVAEAVEETAPPVVEVKLVAHAPEPADTYADPTAAAEALDNELRTPVAPQEMVTEVGEPLEHEVEPEQIHDEIHQLGDNDFEEIEHTHIGNLMPPTFEEPSVEQHALADRLDQHLADVEAEGEHDDLGIGEASGHYQRSKVGLPPAEIYDGEDLPDAPVLDELPLGAGPDAQLPAKLPPEYQEDFIHRFDAPESRDPDLAAYAEPGYAEPAYAEPAHAEPAYAEPAYAEPGYEEPYREDPLEFREPPIEQPIEQPIDQAYEPVPETVDAHGQTVDAAMIGRPAEPGENLDDIEEIDDFEILAEADEEDEDLLSSSGEADASGKLELPPPSASDFAMPARPSHSDFAMRLDLGDDEPEQGNFVPQDVFTPDPFTQQPYVPNDAVPQHADLARSAGHALAGFEHEEDEGSASYTFAEMPQHAAPEHLPPEHLDFDEPHSGFSMPDRFDQSDVIPLNEPHTRPRHDSRAGMPDPPPAAQWDENSNRNQWQSPPAPPNEEVDLESALQALDVDLDDLSAVPHASTELAREGAQRPRATIRPPSESQMPNTDKPVRKSAKIPRSGAARAPRASTEDGVLIDFDDEE